MKLIERVCKWYLGKQNKVAKTAEKRIHDKKLEEASNKLKSLYEFVRFINEKCIRSRRERKTFWKNVSEGHPLVENTIINVLRQMGISEESLKEIQDAKYRAQKQAEAQEVARKNQKEEAEKAKKLAKETQAKGAIVQSCPTDCSADCSKCTNKPVKSEEAKKDETKT